MDFEEMIGMLLADEASNLWREPLLADVFTHPLLSARLDILRSKWIVSLPEFLGRLGALRRMSTPPPEIKALNETLEFFENRLKERKTSLEAWTLYKNFWLGEGGENPVEIRGYAIADERERDAARFRYEYDAPIAPKALIEHNFPIRCQQEGTCVAESIATMLEFLHGEELDELTTRILYEAARDRDGVRAPDGGTTLSPMIAFLQNERLWNAGLLCLNAGDVYTMKKTLAGTVDRRPSPIVAAFRLFGSAVNSVAARHSGKWTLPVTGEKSVGAHAVVIFGYRDDPSAQDVGGGFFIARNSWGEDYACDSPIGMPGYSLVPYSYVTAYCLEAYAADLPKEREEPVMDEFERDYVWSLTEKTLERFEDSDGRVRELRPLKPGDKVVGRRDDPTFVMEYTAENRKEFIDRGYGWSRAGRARVYFPLGGATGLSDQVAARQRAQASFMNGIASNVARLGGRKSTLSRGLLGSVKFQVEEPVDLSTEVRSATASATGLQRVQFDGKDVPNEYREALRASVSCQLWRLDKGKGVIVACFVAPLRFAPGRRPEFVEATEAVMKKVAEAIQSQVAALAPKREVVGVAFGSASGAAEIFVNAAASRFDVVSGSVLVDNSLIGGQRWRTTYNATQDERTAPFRAALNPTTCDENVQVVRKVVDELLTPGEEADPTVELVANRLERALSEREVVEAFDELVRYYGYEYYETRDKKVAIRRRKAR